MLMGVINTHILNYCKEDAVTEAAECSRQVEDELTKAEARIAELESRYVTDEQCQWSVEDEDLALWNTGCGEAWVFTECSPQDSGVKYCPCCGKRAALQEGTT